VTHAVDIHVVSKKLVLKNLEDVFKAKDGLPPADIKKLLHQIFKREMFLFITLEVAEVLAPMPPLSLLEDQMPKLLAIVPIIEIFLILICLEANHIINGFTKTKKEDSLILLNK
jgi:hypothetical protein